MYEKDALARGIPVDTFVRPLKEVDRAITDGEEEGFVKIHVKKGTDKILGATIVARHAGEIISEVTLAMLVNTGLGTLASVIHPSSSPTGAGDENVRVEPGDGLKGVVTFAPGPVGQQTVQVGMPVELLAVGLDGKDGRGHALGIRGVSEVWAEASPSGTAEFPQKLLISSKSEPKDFTRPAAGEEPLEGSRQ